MPPVSQAQRRWAFWVLNNSGSKRLKKVAKDFVGHGVTGLPERVEDGQPVEKAIRLTAHEQRPVQAGKYQQVSHDWHHEGTAENPFNERQRVVTSGEATGIYSLREDPTRLNHFHVQDVRSVTRGGGRAAMEHLTRMADRHQVSLQLVAEPLRPQGDGIKMTRTKLRAWYHGHGFRPRQGDLMVRTPTKMEKSMTPFSELKDRLEKSFMTALASGVKEGMRQLVRTGKMRAAEVRSGVANLAQGEVQRGVKQIASAAKRSGKGVTDAVDAGRQVFTGQRERDKHYEELWRRVRGANPANSESEPRHD